MAEESTGSELKLIHKFINMSVCLNSNLRFKESSSNQIVCFKNLLMTYTWILKLQLSKCKRRGQGFQEQAT